MLFSSFFFYFKRLKKWSNLSLVHIRPRLLSNYNPIKFGMGSHQPITVRDFNRPFRLVHFVFPNTDHVIILRRFGLLFCSLKWGHASMNMPACTLFNKQNKGPSLLSIITWSVLGKTKRTSQKGLLDYNYFKERLGGCLKQLQCVIEQNGEHVVVWADETSNR